MQNKIKRGMLILVSFVFLFSFVSALSTSQWDSTSVTLPTKLTELDDVTGTPSDTQVPTWNATLGKFTFQNVSSSSNTYIYNLFNQVLNTTSNVTFHDVNVTNLYEGSYGSGSYNTTIEVTDNGSYCIGEFNTYLCSEGQVIPTSILDSLCESGICYSLGDYSEVTYASCDDRIDYETCRFFINTTVNYSTPIGFYNQNVYAVNGTFFGNVTAPNLCYSNGTNCASPTVNLSNYYMKNETYNQTQSDSLFELKFLTGVRDKLYSLFNGTGTDIYSPKITFNYNATCNPYEYWNGTGLILNVTGC